MTPAPTNEMLAGEVLGLAPSLDRDMAERQIPETFQQELRALRRLAATPRRVFAATEPEGWTGQKCPVCRGTGENLSNPMNAGRCDSCGGTGDEYRHHISPLSNLDAAAPAAGGDKWQFRVRKPNGLWGFWTDCTEAAFKKISSGLETGWRKADEIEVRSIVAPPLQERDAVRERETHWLIERVGTGLYEFHNWDQTPDPWLATRHKSERDAFERIRERDGQNSLKEFRPTEHIFINKVHAALAQAAKAPAVSEADVGRIRSLDWQETLVDRGDGSSEVGGWEAESGFGNFYSVEQYFASDSYGFLAKFEFDVIGDFDDPDRAKECAQKDFEKRALDLIQSAAQGGGTEGGEA